MVIHGRIDRRRAEELRSSTKGGSELGICYDPVFWAVLCLAGARLCKNQLINKPFVGQHGQGRGDAHIESKKGNAIEGVDKKTYFFIHFQEWMRIS